MINLYIYKSICFWYNLLFVLKNITWDNIGWWKWPEWGKMTTDTPHLVYLLNNKKNWTKNTLARACDGTIHNNEQCWNKGSPRKVSHMFALISKINFLYFNWFNTSITYQGPLPQAHSILIVCQFRHQNWS